MRMHAHVRAVSGCPRSAMSAADQDPSDLIISSQFDTLVFDSGLDAPDASRLAAALAHASLGKAQQGVLNWLLDAMDPVKQGAPTTRAKAVKALGDVVAAGALLWSLWSSCWLLKVADLCRHGVLTLCAGTRVLLAPAVQATVKKALHDSAHIGGA